MCVDGGDAGLEKGVTDSGLQALAFAGCGAHLTSLTLESEYFRCVIVFDVCVGSGVAMDFHCK